MDEKPGKKKRSRSKEIDLREVPFNWELVEKLAAMKAKQTYIAQCLLVEENTYIDKTSLDSKETLIRRKIKERYGCDYVGFLAIMNEAIKVKIYGWQLKACENLNPTMLVHMGKQELGQRDKIDEKPAELQSGRPADPLMTPDEWYKTIKRDEPDAVS